MGERPYAKAPETYRHPGTIQDRRCFLKEDARPEKLVDRLVWITLNSSLHPGS